MFLRLFAAVATAALLASAAHAEAPVKSGQAPGWYRMTLGKFEITALSDGTIEAPVDQLLHNIKPERQKALLSRAYLKSPVETSVNGFLVNTGTKLARTVYANGVELQLLIGTRFASSRFAFSAAVPARQRGSVR